MGKGGYCLSPLLLALSQAAVARGWNFLLLFSLELFLLFTNLHLSSLIVSDNVELLTLAKKQLP